MGVPFLVEWVSRIRSDATFAVHRLVPRQDVAGAGFIPARDRRPGKGAGKCRASETMRVDRRNPEAFQIASRVQGNREREDHGDAVTEPGEEE
jgi:hypothetical protein